MSIVVDHDDRGESATSDAGDRLEGKTKIFRGDLLPFEAQTTRELVEDRLRPAHVAGRSLTGTDDVASPRLQMELGVKRDHPVDLADRNADLFADANQNGSDRKSVV